MKEKPLSLLSGSEKAMINKKQIINDAKMVDEGADVNADGVIIPTAAQEDVAQIEMGKDMYKQYKEAEKRNAYLQEIVDQRIAELGEEINELYRKLFELNGNSDEIRNISFDDFSKEYFPESGGTINGSQKAETLRSLFAAANEKGIDERDIIQKRTQIINLEKKLLRGISEGKELFQVEETMRGRFYTVWLARKKHRTFEHKMLNREFTIEETDALREDFLPKIKDAIFSVLPENRFRVGSGYIALIKELLEALYGNKPDHEISYEKIYIDGKITNKEIDALKEKVMPAIKEALFSVVPEKAFLADADYVVLTKKLLEEFYG